MTALQSGTVLTVKAGRISREVEIPHAAKMRIHRGGFLVRDPAGNQHAASSGDVCTFSYDGEEVLRFDRHPWVLVPVSALPDGLALIVV